MKRILTVIIFFSVVFSLFSNKLALAGSKDMTDMKTLGVLLNYDNPDNELDKGYNSDFSAGIKVAYGLTKEIGASFTFDSFKFNGSSNQNSFDTLTIDGLLANVFYKFNTPANLYPFATAGVGYYMMDHGDDNFGINFGLGVSTELVDLSDMTSLDLSWNYHRILSSGKDPAFFEIRLGLNFNFF